MHIIIFLTGNFSQAIQRFSQLTIILPQKGQYIQSDSITGIFITQITAVCHIRQPRVMTHPDQVRLVYTQQGSDKFHIFFAPLDSHSGKSRHARSPKQTQHNGLGLIISMMG
ncbi:hypothetical protein D3C81_1813320 [compost metagenome]